MEGALVGRAVAEEGQRHPGSLLLLEGQRRADRDGDAAGHDAVGAQDAQVEVGHVQRAALAAAVAGGARGQLGHHVLRVAALGDQVAVPAVRAGDHVVRLQRGARADRGGLLAHAGMDEAGDQPGAPFVDGAQLELAHQEHLAVEVKKFISWIVCDMGMDASKK